MRNGTVQISLSGRHHTATVVVVNTPKSQVEGESQSNVTHDRITNEWELCSLAHGLRVDSPKKVPPVNLTPPRSASVSHLIVVLGAHIKARYNTWIPPRKSVTDLVYTQRDLLPRGPEVHTSLRVKYSIFSNTCRFRGRKAHDV